MNAIVDYGMGNLRNVRRAFEAIGVPVVVTSQGAEVVKADRVILPGVGAFGEAVKRIDALGLREPLLRHVSDGKPLLGICLGMQLLFESSEESPGAAGLSLLQGTVLRFRGVVKVPHIGWNTVEPAGASVLFPPGSGQRCFYFVHSYFVPGSSSCTAMTDYGVRFVSAVQQKNLLGVQFHPEKSQDDGQFLLRNFLEMA